MSDIALPASERVRFRISLPLLFCLLVYSVVLATGATGMLGDSDTYWHIATGRWILEHAAVPSHDVFSFSMPGAAWRSPEWLAEVLFALLYDHLGWGGPLILTGLSFATALSLLLRSLLRYMQPVHAMLATALAWAVALSHLLARPHVLVLPILVVWTAEMVAARTENRAPSLWLAPLMCLWVNLHGSFIFGLGLAGLFAVEALVLAANNQERWAALRSWVVFGAASATGALINPFGIDGVLLPFHLVSMHANDFVLEWQSPDFQHNWGLELWIALILFAALVNGWRLPWTRAAMLLLLLHMTLQHQRYGELLGLVAPLLAAPALAPQLSPTSGSGNDARFDRVLREWAKPGSSLGTFLGALVLVLISVTVLRGDFKREADSVTPAAALAAVAARNIEGPVLNDYAFGGYLVFAGIKPFIDGRYFYGDAFIARYVNAITGGTDELPSLLDQYQITWTLLSPKIPANAVLARLSGWRRLYADEVAVVYVREQSNTDQKHPISRPADERRAEPAKPVSSSGSE